MNKLQLAGLSTFCLAVGLNIGNFSPQVRNLALGVNYALHFLPMVPLLIGAFQLRTRTMAGSRWITITMLIMVLADLVIVGNSLVHPNPSGFGTYTFNDYMPVLFDVLGAGFWCVGVWSIGKMPTQDRKLSLNGRK